MSTDRRTPVDRVGRRAGSVRAAIRATSRSEQPAKRSRQTENRIFTASVVVGMVHAGDDASFGRQPGVELAQHLPGLVAVTCAAVLAIVVFPHLRPGLRSGLTVAGAVIIGANGVLHVMHLTELGPEHSDATGVLAALAAVVMLGLGLMVPVRHRGEIGGTATRRWTRRVLAVVGTAAVAQLVLMPVVVGLVQTHTFRHAIGEPPGPGYQDVSFTSADGLRLAGWYHPSSNGAAVLIVSSARGDRSGSTAHAALLAQHGYGVLLYDARGTGLSEGSPNGWGWGWESDVSGALDFLQESAGIEPHRIGGLGLSTGADVLIESAVADPRLRAVVSDGATGRSFADRPPGLLSAIVSAGMFTSGRLFSGAAPGEPLRELIAEAAPTPILLIAAGSLPGEIAANEKYSDGPSTSLWRLPQVGHTKAIVQVADEYETRVLAHLDTALLDHSP